MIAAFHVDIKEVEADAALACLFGFYAVLTYRLGLVAFEMAFPAGQTTCPGPLGLRRLSSTSRSARHGEDTGDDGP